MDQSRIKCPAIIIPVLLPRMFHMGIDQRLIIAIECFDFQSPADDPVRILMIDNRNPVETGAIKQAQGLFDIGRAWQPGHVFFFFWIKRVALAAGKRLQELFDQQGMQDIAVRTIIKKQPSGGQLPVKKALAEKRAMYRR